MSPNAGAPQAESRTRECGRSRRRAMTTEDGTTTDGTRGGDVVSEPNLRALRVMGWVATVIGIGAWAQVTVRTPGAARVWDGLHSIEESAQIVMNMSDSVQ